MAISVLIIELVAWRLRQNARFEGVALAMCRQSSDENASSDCQSVFQSCHSQIRHIAAEPLSHVITGKGPCDRPYSAENWVFGQIGGEGTEICRETRTILGGEDKVSILGFQ